MSNFHDATNYIGDIIDMNKKNEFNSRNVSSLTGGKMVEGVMVVVMAEEDINMAKGKDVQQIVMLAVMQVKVADMLIALSDGSVLRTGKICQKKKRKALGMPDPIM
jgi:hypothetical protein